MIHPSSPESLSVLGIPVSVFRSYEDAVAVILSRIARRQQTVCVAVNPEKVYRAGQDENLRRLLQQADLHLCDGVGVAIAARLLYRQRLARVTGIQLFLELMGAAEARGLGVFLLGATAESNAGACRRLRREHPRLRILGSQDGYFQDSGAVVRRINASGADMLFVAMGSPKQEEWIAAHRPELRPPFCMGVGGTLDVVSGRVAWAPAICRKTGTEFLYRLIRQPRRWRRQRCLPVFLWQVLRCVLSGASGQRAAASLPDPASSAPGDSERKAA